MSQDVQSSEVPDSGSQTPANLSLSSPITAQSIHRVEYFITRFVAQHSPGMLWQICTLLILKVAPMWQQDVAMRGSRGFQMTPHEYMTWS
jgi:hypothetical protein